MSRHLQQPSWVPPDDTRIRHLFEQDLNVSEWAGGCERIMVVGAGISAAQVALRLQKPGRIIHMVSRHALRKHQFDSDPGWLGPKYMTGFWLEPDYARRREMIRTARNRGSIPPDVRFQLHRAMLSDAIRWVQDEVTEVRAGNCLSVRLSEGTEIETDRILLATGFSATRPGGQMVEELIRRNHLPCAACGYPVVDSYLRWHPQVFVSGALAELELGPTARNIAGARNAAERIVRYAESA